MANAARPSARRTVVLGPASWLAATLLRGRWVAPAGALGATLAAGGLAGCATPTPRAAPPLPPDKAANVVLTAMAFLDVPYRLGGNGGAAQGAGPGGRPGGAATRRDVAADGFDCSGFTRHVYERSLGLVLPRTAWDQAHSNLLARVERADLHPGDLVFFNTLQRAHSHVGLYIGEERFVHAPRTGTRVRVEDMNGAAGRYWTQRFDGARRPVAVT